VFGFSFSELVVVVIVALVVIGPKDLPKMLRKLGQWAGKLRRMASDLRAQSGIDDALRTEGLADDIAEIRKLARGELDAVQRSVTAEPTRPGGKVEPTMPGYSDDFFVVRDREYPRDGADSYGALPDNAIVYAEGLPRSKHARDPLYILGDASAELPPEEVPPVSEAPSEAPPEAGDGGDAGAISAPEASDAPAASEPPAAALPREDLREDARDEPPSREAH